MARMYVVPVSLVVVAFVPPNFTTDFELKPWPRMPTCAPTAPEVTFTKVDTQVDNELGNYYSTMETLIEGALLAVAVVCVLLRDFRATVITAV